MATCQAARTTVSHGILAHTGYYTRRPTSWAGVQADNYAKKIKHWNNPWIIVSYPSMILLDFIY